MKSEDANFGIRTWNAGQHAFDLLVSECEGPREMLAAITVAAGKAFEVAISDQTADLEAAVKYHSEKVIALVNLIRMQDAARKAATDEV